MPPTTPAWLQSIARLGSRMPVHGAAWMDGGMTKKKQKSKLQIANRHPVSSLCSLLFALCFFFWFLLRDTSPSQRRVGHPLNIDDVAETVMVDVRRAGHNPQRLVNHLLHVDYICCAAAVKV